ncbi:MAG TPA: histidine--tRNA ligase [Chitinophagaceae bacterium]|nr:histidine--tRNA ligase [Chitinophagaceae bacterium]
MAKVTPTIPQGTRDFGADEVRKRNFILDTIKTEFELYGFQPLETPAMENLDTLLGKYGEEGDRLIFKILNNGLDNSEKEKEARQGFEKVLKGKNDKAITERALKYDLTIPFARYVAMHHTRLNFPFKRYQVQPVWRADRPQRSRYREFYQCDADVVGSDSLFNEIEFAIIYSKVFYKLGIPGITIKVNHRALLSALAETCGDLKYFTPITVAIDKLEKAGIEKVVAELESKGLNKEQIKIIREYLDIQGTNKNKIKRLEELLGKNENGRRGIADLKFVLSQQDLLLDLTLARGLNYYTGTIFEVTPPADLKIGSIGGGGRYDDLTGLFGVPDIPGVGISFGVDRIYDVMEEMKLFPAAVHIGTQALFFNLGETESRQAFQLMEELRDMGIRCEMYPDTVKFDKQFKYAEKKNIPYVIIIGSKELEEKNCTIKDLRTGKQESVSFDMLSAYTFK